MKSLKINSTPKTPEIVFNPKNGELNISGISVPEDSVGFYKPVTDWLDEYAQNPQKNTVLTFKLAYVNTSSLQALYDILFQLDKIHSEQSQITVNWHFLSEDVDMKEVGEDLQEALDINFLFHEVEEV